MYIFSHYTFYIFVFLLSGLLRTSTRVPLFLKGIHCTIFPESFLSITKNVRSSLSKSSSSHIISVSIINASWGCVLFTTFIQYYSGFLYFFLLRLHFALGDELSPQFVAGDVFIYFTQCSRFDLHCRTSRTFLLCNLNRPLRRLNCSFPFPVLSYTGETFSNMLPSPTSFTNGWTWSDKDVQAPPIW